MVEDSLWTLESPTRTSRMESLSASTATSMDTWQRSVNQRKRNKKHEHVSNVTRKGILPKIAKANRQ